MENNIEKYYVYSLDDPRTGKPFYIGKGSKNRMYDHEKEVKLKPNHPKCQKIKEIVDSGHKVVYRKIKYFADEVKAYEYEAKIIKQIGKENLTNIADGGICKPNWVSERCIEDESFEAMLYAVAKFETMQQKGADKFYILGFQLNGLSDLINLYKEKLYNSYAKYGEEWFKKIVKSCRESYGLNISLRLV